MTILKKCALWLDGSLILSGILRAFNAFLRLCRGSFLIGLFTEDHDPARLKTSRFVSFAEKILNLTPKFDEKKIESRGGFFEKKLPPHAKNFNAEPGWLAGSVLIKYATDAMDTPIPPKALAQEPRESSVLDKSLDGGLGEAFSKASPGKSSKINLLLQWLFSSFPAWGLLAVVAGAPFLPTMLLGGMLAVVFCAALLRYRFRLDLTSVPLLVFMAVALFSGAASLAPASSLRIAALSVVLMSSYLLVRVCFRSRRCLDFVMAVFITAAAFTGLYALYQFAAGYAIDAAWVDETVHAGLAFRAFSTFGNPNVYGTYLLLAIPLAGALALYAKRPAFKLYAAGVTALLLLALALTFSRGCYVALAVAAAFFVLLLEKRLIVVFVAGLFALPFVLPPAIFERVLSVLDFSDTSTLYRFSIWQGALRLLQDFWMAGIGQGMEAYGRAAPLHALAGVAAAHSHNLFLQVFLETGIVGFLAFLGVLACFFRGQLSFMRRTPDPRRRVLSAAMTAAVMGFLVQGMFDYPFHNFSVMLAFFIFLGLAAAAEIPEGAQ